MPISLQIDQERLGLAQSALVGVSPLGCTMATGEALKMVRYTVGVTLGATLLQVFSSGLHEVGLCSLCCES